jgi:CRP-like cAMP-binding protein
LDEDNPMPSRDRSPEPFASLAKSLSQAEIDSLVAMLDRREVAVGEELLTEGAPSPCALLVAEGSFRVLVGGVEVARLEAGSWMGEVSLLDGGPATATIVAARPAVVLALSPTALEELRRTNLGLATHLVRAICVAIAGRVRSASDRLDELRAASAPPPSRSILDALRTLFGAGG